MRGGHYAGYASNWVLFSLENLNFTIFCPNTTPSTSCFELLLFSIRSWNLENFSYLEIGILIRSEESNDMDAA